MYQLLTKVFRPVSRLWLVAVLCSGVPTTAGEDDANVAAEADAPSVDIASLIESLDDEDYKTREEATEALIDLAGGEQGEAIRAKLEELADDPPSAEVKVRLQKIFRGMELAEIRRDAVKLEALFELVRRANAEDFDQDALQLSLAQLARVVNSCTAAEQEEGDWTLPVKFKDVDRQEPGTSVQDGLVITRRGRITSLRNSIVLADVAMDVTSAQDSIIIARAAVNISSPRNCLIIAGYDARVSSARNCVVFSGRNINASIARDCVFASAEPIQVSLAERTTLINSELARRPSREAPTIVETEGLVFPKEEKVSPLADKIQVTYANGDVVLFKRTGGGGEFVARLDKPVEHPDGGLLEELTGWQACYTGSSRYAIFSDGKQFTLLPVTAP